jgi:hypothetical protein
MIPEQPVRLVARSGTILLVARCLFGIADRQRSAFRSARGKAPNSDSALLQLGETKMILDE